MMAFEERERLVVLDLWYVRQGSQKSEHLTPIGQPTACDLHDDERMAEDLSIAEEPSQPGTASPKVLHPDGGVDQRHAERRLRRRRARRRPSPTPPSPRDEPGSRPRRRSASFRPAAGAAP